MVFLFAFGAAAQTAPPKQAPVTLKESTLQLFKAVELNDMPAVKASIKAGADLNAENDESMSAADVAVDKGHFIIAHYLLSRRLLGRTPPIALSPGKAKVAATQAAKAQAKKKFDTPPAKPARKPPAVAATPPPRPPPAPPGSEAGKPPGEALEPEAPATVVRIPRPQEEVAEAPDGLKDSDPFEDSDSPKTPEADKALAEAAPSYSEEIVEVPSQPGESPPAASPPAGKPLAEKSVAQFFKALVELITPGGEKPAGADESREAPGKEAGTESETEKFDDGLPPPEAVPLAESGEGPAAETFDESVIETVVEESEEIVVDVTGDEIRPGESVEGIFEGPPGLSKETDLETVTVETDFETVTVEPDSDG
ncbi:MAG: ankyrin repeat domain-containing protein, partial [Proteobacteria bacterium]|nr:ankyrin repeat domain-containing protein [Pseudomonadota bacterium]